MKPIVWLFLCLISCCAFSQKEEKFVLLLDGQPSLPKTNLPFCALQLLDARFDPVNVGCVARDISFKGITEGKTLAVFPENARTYLPKILHTVASFDSTSTDTLVMLLKQIRITDHFANTANAWHEPETVLTLSCSFYKKNNDRIARIFSVDDVLAEKWPTDKRPDKAAMKQLRTAAVLRLLSAVFSNRNWTSSSTSFPLTEVEAGIKRRLQLPLFTEQILVPGVYKTFEEFKNNSPSIKEIRIGRQNEMIKEVQDLNGNVINPKSFWGLCDGEYRYVYFQQGIHRLYPVDNSFRFVFYRRDGEAGFKQNPDDFSKAATAPVFPFPTQIDNAFSKYTRDEFLYLNMETGSAHTEEVIGAMAPGKFSTKSNQ